jgi:hypothetical protein
LKPVVTSSDVIVLQKDKNGLIQVKLYKNGEGINIVTLTSYPELTGLDKISRTVLFLKEKYLNVLKDAGIITQSFKSAEGYWCGMIDINVYFELDNSPNGQYVVNAKG